MTIWVVVVLIVLAAVLVPAGLLAYTFRRAADATIEACDPADVPPSFGSSVAEFVQAGFLVAGALRITNHKLPDAYVVLLCNEALDTYGRLWVSQAGSSQFALTTPLLGPGLEGTLTSAREAPTTADPMELQQVFPGATVAELLARHLDAQRFLRTQGITLAPADPAGAEQQFRTRWSRDLLTTQQRGAVVTVEVVLRTMLRRPRFLGPLAVQPGIEDRLAGLGVG